MDELKQFYGLVLDVQAMYPRVIGLIDVRVYARPLKDIMNSEGVHYRRCADRTALIGKLAHEESFRVTPVAVVRKRPFQQVKLATGLELVLDKRPYKFASPDSGDVISAGQYSFKNSVRGIIKGESFASWFGWASDEDIEREIGFDTKKYTTAKIKKSTPQDFAKRMRKIRHNAEHKPDAVSLAQYNRLFS